MIHARDDYNRIQDPAGLIPADEPVMLFRAQDKHFSNVLRFYRDLVANDLAMVAVIDTHIARSDAWPKKKTPDL